MNFDILTIFPDVIHAYASESILGRGQKKDLISIKAHNFRAFSPDKHKHVDDKPYGGGPGMVLEVEPIYRCLESINALPPKVIRLLSSRGDIAVDERSLSSKQTASERRTEISHFVRNDKTRIIIMDPAGKKFDQQMAERFAKLDRLVFICGRYEGFDERIYKFVDEKVSVGDYVLAGGELPALTIVEAVSRLVPGVLGNQESLRVETHGKFQIPMTNDQVKSQNPMTNDQVKSQNPMTNDQINHKTQAPKLDFGHLDLGFFKEYPQYTRPEDFMGMKVPKVLLSGDHKKIEEWRKKKSK